MYIPYRFLVLRIHDRNYRDNFISFSIEQQEIDTYKVLSYRYNECNTNVEACGCPQIVIAYRNLGDLFNSYHGKIVDCHPYLENTDKISKPPLKETRIKLYLRGSDTARDNSILYIPKRASQVLFRSLYGISLTFKKDLEFFSDKIQDPNLLIF